MPSVPNAPHGKVLPFDPKGTNHLVRPGDRDTYAELMAGVPDLDVGSHGLGYDAMQGAMSPLSQQEVQAAGQGFITDDGAAEAYPSAGRGAVSPMKSAPELGRAG